MSRITIRNNMIDITAILQCDYLGNIYLKYKNDYYMVSLDSDVGAVLSRIEYPESFKKNLIEMCFLKKETKSGLIKSGHDTLRGKIHDSISNMTEDEIEDYMSKNDYMSIDPYFVEKKHYWVQYQEDDNDDINDNFYLNGVVNELDIDKTDGMVYSDLLSLSCGTFDTILIKGDNTSKNVVSVIERIDGHCTSRLTVYTSGHFRANFFDKVKYSVLCVDTAADTLILARSYEM